MELLLLLAFLMGWVVAQVQESQSRKARLSRLESLTEQAKALESELALVKEKLREQHLALGWDLQK